MQFLLLNLSLNLRFTKNSRIFAPCKYKQDVNYEQYNDYIYNIPN
nr:MAG TPA: hypothetical protein [Caudoviricetes sp.]